MTARRAMESITLDRGEMHMKDDFSPRYAEMVYNGLWFSPERYALQAELCHWRRARQAVQGAAGPGIGARWAGGGRARASSCACVAAGAGLPHCSWPPEQEIAGSACLPRYVASAVHVLRPAAGLANQSGGGAGQCNRGRQEVAVQPVR